MARLASWLWLAAVLVGGILTFVGLSWHVASLQVAPQRSIVGAPPAQWTFPVHPVNFPASDGIRLQGWYAPADSNKAVVLLHAYGGDRRAMAGRVPLLRRAGFSVLLYDARASGESDGNKRSFGYYERADLRGALAYLRGQGVREIVCVGWSQGAATILMAAADLEDVRAVILEAGFDTLWNDIDHAFRRHVYLPGWIAGAAFKPFLEHRLGFAVDEFRPVDHFARLSCPVLIISGDQDQSAWVRDSLALFQAARAPKDLWLVPGATHENLYAYAPNLYADKVLGFLTRHLSQQASSELR